MGVCLWGCLVPIRSVSAAASSANYNSSINGQSVVARAPHTTSGNIKSSLSINFVIGHFILPYPVTVFRDDHSDIKWTLCGEISLLQKVEILYSEKLQVFEFKEGGLF